MAQARHLKMAKLNHSQISAKYLITLTPNCFAWAAAVVSARLGNNIAEKCAKFSHFCTIWSVELNSALTGKFCMCRTAEPWHP